MVAATGGLWGQWTNYRTDGYQRYDLDIVYVGKHHPQLDTFYNHRIHTSVHPGNGLDIHREECSFQQKLWRERVGSEEQVARVLEM